MIHFSWLKILLFRSKKWLIMHTVNRDHDTPFLTRLQLNPNSSRKIRQIDRKKTTLLIYRDLPFFSFKRLDHQTRWCRENTQRNLLHSSSDDFFQIDSQENTRSWLVNCLYHNAVRRVSNLLWGKRVKKRLLSTKCRKVSDLHYAYIGE